MQRVLDEAKRVGARLAFAALPPPVRGIYLADQDLTLISDRLDEEQAAETGAHELAHRHYGDRCSTEANEMRAWIYASKILIQIEPYMQAEIEDPHPLAIAHRLGTTRRIVELYQQHHLHAQALSAPRDIFGEHTDEDYDEDGMFRHSLRHDRRMRCGIFA